MSRQRFLADCT